MLTTSGKLCDHFRGRARGVAQGFDGRVLREFCHTGVGVDREQVQLLDDGRGRHCIAETPSRHGEALRKAINDDGAVRHLGIAQHGDVAIRINDARVDFVGQNVEIVLNRKFGNAALLNLEALFGRQSAGQEQLEQAVKDALSRGLVRRARLSEALREDPRLARLATALGRPAMAAE